VMTAFPVFAEFTEQLREFILSNLVPQASSRVISVYVQQFSGNAARLTAAGVTLLGVSAIMLMLTIDRAFNTIWRVKRARPIVQRVLIYWSLLTVGPLLIGGSLTLWSWLLSASMSASQQIPEFSIVVFKIVPLILTSAAFGLLYRLVPNRQVSVLDAVVGGVIAAMAFEGMKLAFGRFITEVGNYNLVYGAFASIPIFLLWIYLSWVVVVFAAVITAVLPYWRTGGVKRIGSPGSQFVDALEIMGLLARSHREGDVKNLQQLRSVVKIAWEDMEAILDKLLTRGWVAKLQGNGWVLARDASRIRLIDVYRAFVFSEEASNSTEEQLLRSLVTRIAKNTDDVIDMSLAELFFAREGRGSASRAA
ncbi:MAG: YihY family inner membrane protein, partial [Burkholderiales bacterium]